MRLLRFVLALPVALVAFAQVPPSPAPAAPEAQLEDLLGRSTPYGTVTGFLKAVSGNDLPRAVQYLNVRGKNAQETAEQLKAVLDWGLSGNLASVSRNPEGKASDGLPAARERLGKVVTAAGELDIVYSASSHRPREFRQRRRY